MRQGDIYLNFLYKISNSRTSLRFFHRKGVWMWRTRSGLSSWSTSDWRGLLIKQKHKYQKPGGLVGTKGETPYFNPVFHVYSKTCEHSLFIYQVESVHTSSSTYAKQVRRKKVVKITDMIKENGAKRMNEIERLPYVDGMEECWNWKFKNKSPQNTSMIGGEGGSRRRRNDRWKTTYHWNVFFAVTKVQGTSVLITGKINIKKIREIVKTENITYIIMSIGTIIYHQYIYWYTSFYRLLYTFSLPSLYWLVLITSTRETKSDWRDSEIISRQSIMLISRILFHSWYMESILIIG